MPIIDPETRLKRPGEVPAPEADPLEREPPWLDRLPRAAALSAALVIGAALGWALLRLPPTLPLMLKAALFLLALAGAAALARQGAPRLVGRLPAPARQRRGLVPEGWWVPIPAGEFLMGSADDEPGRYDHEGPVHRVGLSAFECLRVPVTRGLVRRVQSGRRWSLALDGRYPAVELSWFDAVKLCNRFSEADGCTPCYRIDGDQVHWDRDADGWRLLTEAEWEYACRAGTGTRWSCGDDEARLGAHAWYDRNAGGRAHPVGRRRANPWGLCDMHGLVWEWCWDWHGRYSPDAAEDPAGPASGSSRVLRGGAFYNRAGHLRSANRNWLWPKDRYWFIGFRCARARRRQP